MKTKHFLFLLICLGASCTEESDFLCEKDAIVDSMPLKQTRSGGHLTSNGYGGTYLSVERSSSYENVFYISWTLGKYCFFSSLDVRVEIPVTNRWEILAGDPLNNSYVYTIGNNGMYSFYLNYYEEGIPEYPLRTDREICLGSFWVNSIPTNPPVPETHDYSKIRFSFYEISGDNRYVTFSGITSLADYKLVLTSPYIRDFASVQNIYTSPASQSISFYLPEDNLYSLGVYAADCSKDYNECMDYKILQFSNAIPHFGLEPIDMR